MTATLLSLTLTVLVGASDTKTDKSATADQPRKPNPYAPSLAELSEEEEKSLDKIVDRFMQYDIGNLRGKEGAQAYREFLQLGPDAIPALIRGINRAATYEDSCPVTVIAAKLRKLLAGSTDIKLMQFVRDEVGAGVGRTRHTPVLQELRLAVTLHRNALVRAGYTVNSAARAPRLMSISQLAEEAGKQRGPRLKQVLLELSTRSGDEPLAALGSAAAGYERDVQLFARNLLVQMLTRQKPDVVKAKLKDDSAEVRLAAVRVANTRNLRVVPELIDLVDDDDQAVREQAQVALIRAAAGRNFGPARGASKEARQKAAENWRIWWNRQQQGKR